MLIHNKPKSNVIVPFLTIDRISPTFSHSEDPVDDSRLIRERPIQGATVETSQIKDVFDWFRGKALTRKGKSMFTVSSNKKNTCCWQKNRHSNRKEWVTQGDAQAIKLERAMFAPLSFLSTWTASGKRELQHDWKHLNESGVSSPAKHRL